MTDTPAEHGPESSDDHEESTEDAKMETDDHEESTEDVEVDTDTDETEIETITEGYFEEEYYLDAEDAGEFLGDLAEQLRSDDEISVSGDDWELPFRFGEPVSLEIEFEGSTEPELEIEVELAGRTDDEPPELE